MAEALGIAAAAVQFIEISAKLLIAASKLRSKLENAPAKVKHTERSVKQLVSLVERLDADLQPTSSASLADVLSDSSKLEAQNLLEDCISETSALTGLLERLMGKPDDTFVKGKMRAFVSVKKEDEIAERCTRLQDLKSHLSIWYHHQSLLLMRQQMLAISLTNVTVEDLRHEINTRFSTLQDSLQPQEVTQTVSLVYLVLTRHPSSFSLSFPAQSADPKQANDTGVKLFSKPSLVRDLCQRGGLSVSRDFSQNCTCRKPSYSRNKYQYGPFLFQQRLVGIHEQTCSYYKKEMRSTTNITFSTTFNGLVSRGIELSFMSSHGAGGFSLSPGLRTVNIVDPEISPAFRHFQQARQVIGGLFEFYDPNRPFTFRELHMGLDAIGPLREAFENLHEGIRHVFILNKWVICIGSEVHRRLA